MKITIHQFNHDSNPWTESIYPEVTEIVWKAGELNKEILSKFPNLRELDCSYNEIISLEPLSSCVNIQILYCSANQIKSLEPISLCINIQHLYCRNNQITSLDHIKTLTNLTKLNCSNNKIKSIDSLQSCPNLEYICLSNNQVTSLDALASCSNLQYLYCYYNQITSLEPISECTKLKELYCGHNIISSLSPISKCTNLTDLRISSNQITSLEPVRMCANLRFLEFVNNQITSLEPLIHLRRLENLFIHGNPLETPTIRIKRFLEYVHNHNRNSSIYYDKQNVHDTFIQKSVCDSIQRLLKDPKTEFDQNQIYPYISNPKVIELLKSYFENDAIHSIHFLTYRELFNYVWNRIINSQHKTELIRIFEEQILESEDNCLTGRFNRTLSVLVGFYDDIKIEISNKSRISAIIIATRKKIHPYNVQTHRNLSKLNLLEAGYTDIDINPWIDAIE